MGIFAFLPGMPVIPFLSLAITGGIIAYVVKRNNPFSNILNPDDLYLEEEEGSHVLRGIGPGTETAKLPPGGPDFDQIILVDILSLELGFGVLSLADKTQNGDLLERVTGVRKCLAKELGIIIPPIAVRDNSDLEANQYRFLLRSKEIARGLIVPNRWLAMNVSNSPITMQGIPTVEPVFGLDAVWITDEEKKTAEIHGYTVVDAPSVLITHLSETLRDSSHMILEREDTQKLIDIVKERNPTLINELLPDLASVGLIQRVLQNLLKEKVSIKNLTIILETIADYASVTKNPDELAEQTRKRLGVYFVPEYESEPGIIKALTLEPKLEQLLATRVKRSQFEIRLMMDPALAQHFLNELAQRVENMMEQGLRPVLVTSTELRMAFKRFFEPSFPKLSVLAYQEMPNKIQIQNFGIIGLPSGVAAVAPVETKEETPQPVLV